LHCGLSACYFVWDESRSLPLNSITASLSAGKNRNKKQLFPNLSAKPPLKEIRKPGNFAQPMMPLFSSYEPGIPPKCLFDNSAIFATGIKDSGAKLFKVEAIRENKRSLETDVQAKSRATGFSSSLERCNNELWFK
jgi:hypothetical protein